MMSRLPVSTAGGSSTVVDWKFALIEQPRTPPHEILPVALLLLRLPVGRLLPVVLPLALHHVGLARHGPAAIHRGVIKAKVLVRRRRPAQRRIGGVLEHRRLGDGIVI